MEPRNFLFLSLDAALIGDVARLVADEGHDVRSSIESETDREIADGIVPQTGDWRADLDWADVVVFDDVGVGDEVGTGEHAEQLRAEELAVVVGTPATDRLEADRGFAMDVLENHGVETLEPHEFREFGAAVEHVLANPAPCVFKHLGEVQNVKRLVYVGCEDDGSDVVEVRRAYETVWGHRMKGFELQRRVESVGVAVCGFFNGERFVEPVNFNFNCNCNFNFNFNFEHDLRDLVNNSPTVIGAQTAHTPA